jgi:hypothetical protein
VGDAALVVDLAAAGLFGLWSGRSAAQGESWIGWTTVTHATAC